MKIIKAEENMQKRILLFLEVSLSSPLSDSIAENEVLFYLL